MKTVAFFFSLCYLPIFSTHGPKEHITNEFVVKVAKQDWGVVVKELEALHVRFRKKITAGYYLFEDIRYDQRDDRIAREIETNIILKKKVKHFEHVREYTLELPREPIDASAVSSDAENSVPDLRHCPTFLDMGVEAAWAMGYSGKGVSVAITDVGINTDIPDLQPNIVQELSYNCIDDSNDITPEQCSFNSHFDHGNRCAGIVGAVKNNICGDGISYNASIVGIKISQIKINERHETCNDTFKSSWIGQGLLQAIDQVDIYSNSWSTRVDFATKSQLVDDALRTGTTKERNGKGVTYVFPVGNLSDPFTNSLHTIAVNGVGNTGYPAPSSPVCACTLTSAYSEQSMGGPTVLYTTSNARRSKCTLDFEGTSASAAIISGIIGLALQANPELSWRDIQDIIVHSSDSKPLAVHNNFMPNGVGKRYHPVLGFGLLNASTLISLARTRTHLSKQLKMVESCSEMIRVLGKNAHPFVEGRIDVKCHQTCVNRTESVLVEISYESSSEHNAELILTSPQKTSSLLMDRKQSAVKGRVQRLNVVFKSVNFWGEDAKGRWKITLRQHDHGRDFGIFACTVTIYGTGFVNRVQQQTTIPQNDKISTKEPDGQGTSTEHNFTEKRRLQENIPISCILIIVFLLLALFGLIIAICLYRKNSSFRNIVDSAIISIRRQFQTNRPFHLLSDTLRNHFTVITPEEPGPNLINID